MYITDPPYNVDYGGTINGKDRNIANDNLSEDEFYQFLLSFYKAAEANLKKGAPVYVFHSTKESVNFIKAMVNAGFKYAQTLVWYKNHFTLGRQDYQWIHEPSGAGTDGRRASKTACGNRTSSRNRAASNAHSRSHALRRKANLKG